MKFLLLLFVFFQLPIYAKDKPEDILKAEGITLEKNFKNIGNYLHVVRVHDLLYLTGKGPILPTGKYVIGKVGKELTLEEGANAARLTIIHQLSVLKSELGELSKIEKFVKLNAAVNSVDTFSQHPQVVDGASNLLTKVFGDNIGKHARTVIGVNSLPMNIPIEIDLIVKIKK